MPARNSGNQLARPNSLNGTNSTGSPGSMRVVLGHLDQAVRLDQRGQDARAFALDPLRHGPAVRAGDQPRAQIFAPVRLHDKAGRHQERPRLRPAAAAERHQQRAGKAQEADHGGDRIARQTDEHRAAEAPERERPARLDRDLPKMQLAEAVDGPDHVVLVAARDAARGDHRIAVGRSRAQGLRHRLRPIGQDAEIGHPAAEARSSPNRIVRLAS